MPDKSRTAVEEDVNMESDDDSSSVGEGEYSVEALLGRTKKGGEWLYKVRWKGYDENADSWEPESNLNCPDLLEAFIEKEGISKKHGRNSLSHKDSSPAVSDTDSIPLKKQVEKKRKIAEEKDGRNSVDENVPKEKKKAGRPKKNHAVPLNGSTNGNAKGQESEEDSEVALALTGKSNAKSKKSSDAPAKPRPSLPAASTSAAAKSALPRSISLPSVQIQVQVPAAAGPSSARFNKPKVDLGKMKFHRYGDAPVSRAEEEEGLGGADLFSEDSNHPEVEIPEESKKAFEEKLKKGKGKSKAKDTEPNAMEQDPTPNASSSQSVSNDIDNLPTYASNPANSRDRRDSGLIIGPFSVFNNNGGNKQLRDDAKMQLAPMSTPPMALDPRKANAAKAQPQPPLPLKAEPSANGTPKPVVTPTASTSKATPKSSKSSKPTVDEKAKRDLTYLSLEKKLRKSAWFAKHKKVIEGKGQRDLAVACAEALNIAPDILLGLRGLACAITTAQPNTHDAFHDAEHWALGLVLLKASATLPKSPKEIDVVFIHRKHKFQQLAGSLVDLTEKTPYVRFIEWGEETQPQIVLSAGYAVVPTLSALQNPADVENMIALKKKYALALAIHPATYVLARSKGIASLTDNVARLMTKGHMPIIAPIFLSSESVWSQWDKTRLLEASDDELPVVTIESEFADTQKFLYNLREEKRDKGYRRYVMLVDKPVKITEDQCKKVGIALLNFDSLKEKVEHSVW